MSDQTHQPSEDDDVLAAEYVVGVLSEDERTAVEARMVRDAGFAGLVSAWTVRLQDLNEGYGDIPPPSRVKAAIDARLFGTPAKERSGFFGFLMGALTATAIMAIVVVLVFVPQGAPLEVALAAEDGSYAFEVVINPDRNGYDIALTTGDVPADTDFQLWLIAEGAAPVSLGVFERDGRALVDVSLDLSGADLLAVSLEPVGGSPTGQPTGPVLAVGAISAEG